MNPLLSNQPKALLALADGVVFEGLSVGAAGETKDKVLVCTYPQIGNYGVNPDDQVLDRPVLAGVVMRDLCYTPSSFRLTGDLPSYLRKNGIVGIEGVDTRALAMHLRDAGPLAAIISTVDLDPASLARRAQALNATTEGREI